MNNFIYNYIREDYAPDFDFKDKKRCVWYHISQMLIRTQSMFKYKGLPESIPERNLEIMLQTRGHVAWYHTNGDLYVFIGGLGGEPDPYYMPTVYTIANPALNISKNLKIGEDCVVMPSDSLYQGLMPILSHYATGITENELSMRTAIINTRIVDLISAQDERTAESARQFLRDVEDGKLGVIAETALLEGLKAQPYGTKGSTQVLTDLIEMEQYWKASLFNELGLNANYNMKRESLNSAESQLNNDALLPLVDDMLKCRRESLEKVNDMFGTDIEVDFSSSWKYNIEEAEAELKTLAPGVTLPGNDTLSPEDSGEEIDSISPEIPDEPEETIEDTTGDDIIETIVEKIDETIIDKIEDIVEDILPDDTVKEESNDEES